MNKFHIVIFILSIFALSSCSGGKTSEIISLVAERDSLSQLTKQQEQELTKVNEMVDFISQTLDSISYHENMIFIDKTSAELPITKSKLLSNLSHFEQVLHRQQEKINALSAALNELQPNSEMANLVNFLNAQIAKKDREIAQLRADLSKKNVDIDALKRKVEAQQNQLTQQEEAITQLSEANANKEKALKEQDNVINTCYMLIATKKELENLGIIKKGKLASSTTFNNNYFKKVDIRKCNELSFKAKKAKMLTYFPADTYNLVKNGDYYTLTILNPTTFWSVSNYLIIQTN